MTLRLPSLAVLVSFVALAPSVRAEEMPKDQREVIARALEWLVANQKGDGHWEAANAQYPTAMTGMAGMALLMEGSTLREGKYTRNIRKAVQWLTENSQPSGLLVDSRNPTEMARFIHGHGYALLFLASAYGEEEDDRRRKELEEVLVKAVKFSASAQTPRGGWGYVAAKDGNNFDEGSTTIAQLQALYAARAAGIKVPRAVIDSAAKYMKDSTTERGGVLYSLGQGRVEGGVGLVTGALATSFSAGEYDSPLVKKYLEYCKTQVPAVQKARIGHDDYIHYYYAQARYVLGEEGYATLFPTSRPEDRLTWSRYKTEMFRHLKETQTKDGSWNGGMIGPIYATAINLTILQLENGTLPLYQR